MTDTTKPQPGTPAWRAYWQARIDAAQTRTMVELQSERYRRIPYGEEDHNDVRPTCPDCGCAPGQLHVEHCDQEQCPRCAEQALACDCNDDA